MNDLICQIKEQEQIRQNLSTLRTMIKETDSAMVEFVSLFVCEPDFWFQLFENEDAKTRKNMALLLKDICEVLRENVTNVFGDSTQTLCSKILDTLMEYYQKECQEFVKPSYLLALKSYDYSSILSDLKFQLQTLTDGDFDDLESKHRKEQIRILGELILDIEGIKKHKFNGYHLENDCVLITNSLHKTVTSEQISAIDNLEFKPFKPALRFTTTNLKEVLEVRTFSTILFLVPTLLSLPNNPIKAAKKIADSNLIAYLSERHNGTIPFYFRIDLKSNWDLNEKSEFCKKLASEVEVLTDRQLINSPTHYELELRLIQNKQGDFNVMLKLNTIGDDRFSYRREHIASSLKPVNAALLVQLAKNYMIEDARVLDPFCGVGTLLIERQKVVKGNTSYGIDSLEQAITKAKVNTELAGQIIHYIHRDFFRFTHEYPFDEIFTDMPFYTNTNTSTDIYVLYENFFEKAKEHLTNTGTIIMYSRNPECVPRLAYDEGFEIVDSIEVSRKDCGHLFIIKRQPE